jgi:hypothetical protein
VPLSLGVPWWLKPDELVCIANLTLKIRDDHVTCMANAHTEFSPRSRKAYISQALSRLTAWHAQNKN